MRVVVQNMQATWQIQGTAFEAPQVRSLTVLLTETHNLKGHFTKYLYYPITLVSRYVVIYTESLKLQWNQQGLYHIRIHRLYAKLAFQYSIKMSSLNDTFIIIHRWKHDLWISIKQINLTTCWSPRYVSHLRNLISAHSSERPTFWASNSY